MQAKWFLIAAGALMAALGLLRGGGGAALLLRGPALDPAIRAGSGAVALVGGALLLLGLLLLVAAIGVFRRARRFWWLGLIVTIAFAIDGLINGLVLYGRPGAGGTAANLVVAMLILICLALGRAGLGEAKRG
jgi:lysylphosphatidylglycerol synthetase-like protein (DUF2156 family)